MIEHIKKEGIYSESFENSVPTTISFIKSAEDKLVESGVKVAGTTDQFVQFYYDLGCAAVQADDDIDDNELKNLNIYMNTIYNFVGTVDRKIAERGSSDSNATSYDNQTEHIGKILPNLDFSTIKLAGFGSKVCTDVELPNCALFVTAIHTLGDSNFSVCYYDSDGNESSYFINEIGEYQGTILFDNSNAEKETGIIEVKADGKWSLEFIAIPNAVGINGSSNINGHGSTVSDAFAGNGKPNVVKIKHLGESNFCVRVISDDGDNDMIINEIGLYSGEKVVKLQKGVRYFWLLRQMETGL